VKVLLVDTGGGAERRWVGARADDDRSASAGRSGRRLGRSQCLRRRSAWTPYRRRLCHAPISTQHPQLHRPAVRHCRRPRPRVSCHLVYTTDLLRDL